MTQPPRAPLRKLRWSAEMAGLGETVTLSADGLAVPEGAKIEVDACFPYRPAEGGGFFVVPAATLPVSVARDALSASWTVAIPTGGPPGGIPLFRARLSPADPATEPSDLLSLGAVTGVAWVAPPDSDAPVDPDPKHVMFADDEELGMELRAQGLSGFAADFRISALARSPGAPPTVETVSVIPAVRVVDGSAVASWTPAADVTSDGPFYFDVTLRPAVDGSSEANESAAASAAPAATGRRSGRACRRRRTARIVAVTFRSDHLADVYTGTEKLIRPSARNASGRYAAADREFQKPEWERSARGIRADPISQTRGTAIVLDIELDLRLRTKDPVTLTRVVGDSDVPAFRFDKMVNLPVVNGRVTIPEIVATELLPDYVHLAEDVLVSWAVTLNGKRRYAGRTSHTAYVTLDRPVGRINWDDSKGVFVLNGGDDDVQHVTEERLRYAVKAVARIQTNDEKACVDEVFRQLTRDGVGYFLGRRWGRAPDPDRPGVELNETGVWPKPPLHQYLWLCMGDARRVKGECHNIAAAFILACRILGVVGDFEVGYMYPWPSRSEREPAFPRRGDSVLGKYGNGLGGSGRYRRDHDFAGHGREKVLFLDGRDQANNFEGVARYGASALYAIGDARFDLRGTPDENASVYFAVRTASGDGGVGSYDLTTGGFELIFFEMGKGGCQLPYPDGVRPVRRHSVERDERGRESYIVAAAFKWEAGPPPAPQPPPSPSAASRQTGEPTAVATDAVFNETMLQLIDAPDDSVAALLAAARGGSVRVPSEAIGPAAEARSWAVRLLRGPFEPPADTPFVALPAEAGGPDVVRARYRANGCDVEIGQTVFIISVRVRGVPNAQEQPVEAYAAQVARLVLATNASFTFTVAGTEGGRTFGTRDVPPEGPVSDEWPHWVDALRWWREGDEVGFITVKAAGQPTKQVVGTEPGLNVVWFAG